MKSFLRTSAVPLSGLVPTGPSRIARTWARPRSLLVLSALSSMACSQVQLDEDAPTNDSSHSGDGDTATSGGASFASSGGSLSGTGGTSPGVGGELGGQTGGAPFGAGGDPTGGGTSTGGTSASGGGSSGGSASGGASSGGGAASCSSAPWSESTHWTEYTVGDLRERDGGEWECVNVAWCWKDPTGSDGSLGWDYVGSCDGSGTGGSSSGGSSSGGASSSGGSAGSGGAPGAGGSASSGGSSSSECDGIEDILSEAEFNAFFPSRNAAYTYDGMVDAINGEGDLVGFPTFAREGSCDTRKREVAAFLANVARETGRLIYIEQIDKSYPYCADRPYGCPAGTYQYFGRGPIQLSWNYNYYTASMALFGDDRLLQTPSLVATNSAIAWATAIWFWMTSSGAGVDTCHAVTVDGLGFGETIRTINGGQECNGGNSAAVSQRVCYYEDYVAALGTTVGPGHLDCGTAVNRGAYCD